jgi:hypothetical protein
VVMGLGVCEGATDGVLGMHVAAPVASQQTKPNHKSDNSCELYRFFGGS